MKAVILLATLKKGVSPILMEKYRRDYGKAADIMVDQLLKYGEMGQ